MNMPSRRIFELHFNPKLKKDQIFDSFVYEPENIYEKELGSLYIAGELRNTLPQNSKFLDNLAKVIKKNHYTFLFKSPEKALSHSLKKTNEFLAEEVKKENVSWLGNLNFAALSLKDSSLFFTKTGDLKILLLRAGQIIDIGKNLDLREIEPYPLKIFLNVVSGKLVLNDIILVLTKDVFEFFQQQNLLTKIAQVLTPKFGGEGQAETLNAKKIKEILPSSLFIKGEGSKISGICFLTIVKPRLRQGYDGQAILFQEEKKFSFPKIRFPFKFPRIIKKPRLPKINPVKFASQLFNRVNPIKLLRARFAGFNRVKLPKIKILDPGPIIERFRHRKYTKKKLVLVLAFILFLFLGFLIFKKTEERKENKIKVSLSGIQEKVAQAENFLIFKNEEDADSLFKEAWKEILFLTEAETSLRPDIISLKQSIEASLENLNKLEKIENPEVIAEPPPNLFSSPSGSLVGPPLFEFNFDLSVSYLSNLYFLDKKTCEIIKYTYLSKSKWGSPKKWIKDKGPCSEPKSMTVDGAIWILNNDNSLLRYYAGSLQETITLDFFPLLENIIKIKTKANVPYLYLLEPAKKRVVIVDKTGKIVKQFQSEKFDNLKDIDISDNGKTIYLLSDSEVYKIEME